MANSTQTAAGANGGVIPPLPQIPAGGEALYNEIMGKIEPELLTTAIDAMKEKYKDETPEQSKARAERYSKALEEYDKQFAEYAKNADQTVHDYQRAMVGQVEKDGKKSEEQTMNDLESAISNI